MGRNESSKSQHAVTRRHMMISTAAAFGSLTAVAAYASVAVEEGISHSAEAIHQEPVLQAPRERIYEALTEASKFDQIVRLSQARQSGAVSDKPSVMSSEVGGAFALFGGYIVGRQLDLAPNERIVQAWRSESWKPGDYSIVRFELVEQGAGTKIIFDHRGFPPGQAPHLAAGWKANYWEPLEKYLQGAE